MLCTVVIFGNTLVFFYMSIAVPLGRHLFGSTEAGKWLGDVCALSNGIVGMTFAPWLGILVDRYGFGLLVYSQLLLLYIFVLTFWIPTSWAAIIACVSNVAYTSLSYTSYSSWFIYFAPPNRLGMVSGVWFLGMSFISAIVTIGLTSWSSIIPPGVNRFFWPLAADGAAALISMTMFCLSYYLQSPFPEAPRLLKEDEVEIAQNWGVESLAELSETLGVESKRQLVRLLSSTRLDDVQELAELVEASWEEGSEIEPVAARVVVAAPPDWTRPEAEALAWEEDPSFVKLYDDDEKTVAERLTEPLLRKSSGS